MPGGRPRFKPTDQDRKTVEIMVASGIPHADVALCIGGGIDVKTLKKHFREELDTASIRANAKMGQNIFNQAMNGNTSAAIWWSKARMGWKETQAHEHAGKDGVPLTLWGKVVDEP